MISLSQSMPNEFKGRAAKIKKLGLIGLPGYAYLGGQTIELGQ